MDVFGNVTSSRDCRLFGNSVGGNSTSVWKCVGVSEEEQGDVSDLFLYMVAKRLGFILDQWKASIWEGGLATLEVLFSYLQFITVVRIFLHDCLVIYLSYMHISFAHAQASSNVQCYFPHFSNY